MDVTSRRLLLLRIVGEAERMARAAWTAGDVNRAVRFANLADFLWREVLPRMTTAEAKCQAPDQASPASSTGRRLVDKASKQQVTDMPRGGEPSGTDQRGDRRADA